MERELVQWLHQVLDVPLKSEGAGGLRLPGAKGRVAPRFREAQGRVATSEGRAQRSRPPALRALLSPHAQAPVHLLQDTLLSSRDLELAPLEQHQQFSHLSAHS